MSNPYPITIDLRRAIDRGERCGLRHSMRLCDCNYCRTPLLGEFQTITLPAGKLKLPRPAMRTLRAGKPICAKCVDIGSRPGGFRQTTTRAENRLRGRSRRNLTVA
jgi:hypothetical protein